MINLLRVRTIGIKPTKISNVLSVLFAKSNGVQYKDPHYYNILSSRSFATDPKLKPDPEPEEVVIQSKTKSTSVSSPESDQEGLKPSFAKGLFLGKFDTDVLTFPEVLEKESQETLNELLAPIERYFEEKVDSKKIDQDAKIPDQVLTDLKNLGLFGLQIPPEYGGLGLNATAYARVGEVTCMDGGIAVTLAAHQAIGLKGLLLYGTEEQKKKYLPRLSTGEMVAAFALTEPSTGSDAASVQTSAKLSPDRKHWILNGSKLWISNGGIADFFTVFASTAGGEIDVASPKRVTAFLVERKFGGVTNGKPEDKLGIRGSNTCEVHFDNTHVPVENILGELGGGFKIAVNILNSGRFSMGSAGAGMLRKLIKAATEHAIQRVQFGKPLKDFGLIKDKIARMTIDAYIMESMSYLTAGLIDSGLYEDCSLEAAMVKVYSSEACWNAASECIQIFGGLGYMKDYPYERCLRDARILSIFEGTNEILRLYIALMGVQFAGKGLREVVKKLRNPFAHPNYFLKKAMQRMMTSKDSPKLLINLKSFLHPSLEHSATWLEYSVARFQYITEVCLQDMGTNITNQQLVLKRLATLATDIFIMTSVLARASRAYCTGIQNAEDEVLIATTVCSEATARNKVLVKELEDGQYLTNDYHRLKLADRVFESKGYPITHPLIRNIW